jgi:hypothetical protein
MRLAVERFLNGDMRHRRSGRRAVPMFLAGRKPHHVARMDFLGRTALALNAAETRSHDQCLAKRVGVPRGARPGFEGDVGTAYARGEHRILDHRDLAHEGEDAWIAKFFRRIALVGDVSIEHGPRRYIGQTVIRCVPGGRRPLLGSAPGHLVAPSGRCDFDRCYTIERACLFGDRDASDDRSLRVRLEGDRARARLM